jgi:hypothetical protein
MTQSPILNLATSVAFFCLGAGVIYVTWFNPSSRLAPILSARWRIFGPLASKFGAAAQVAALFSLALLTLLSWLNSPYVKVAFIPFSRSP